MICTFLILLPWSLIALPGRDKGGGATTGFSATLYQHGWPFVGLNRQTVRYSGSILPNGKFQWGVKPTNIDFDSQATRWLEPRLESQKSALLGLQFNESSQLTDCTDGGGISDSSVLEFSFWSDATHWPFVGDADGESTRINWFGSIVNLLLLAIIFQCSITCLEYRLSKRGTHFSFRLIDLLITISVIAVFLAWLTTEYRRASKEKQVVDRLVTSMSGLDQYLEGQRGNSMPSLVSELLDHRSSIPFVNLRLFRPVTHARLDIYELPEEVGTADNSKAVVESISDATFPVSLDLRVHQSNVGILEGLADSPAIKGLDLTFGFDVEWDNATDKYHDIDLNLELTLPNAEIMTVWLQSEIDQKKQLQTIAGVRHLKTLKIYSVSREGVAFLNSIAERLPAQTWVDFELEDDDDEDDIELRPPLKRFPQNADETFGASDQGFGGVF